MIELLPADVFLTRGSSWLSRAIRFFTRGAGEARTKVNHVGLVVQGGPIDDAVVVEALSTVKQHKLIDKYGGGRSQVAVYRPVNLAPAELETVVSTARGYVGRKYGFVKILAHLGDWVLQGAYVFRRLAVMDEYPICSWLVAHAFKQAGKSFGVAARAATPDDISSGTATSTCNTQTRQTYCVHTTCGSRRTASATLPPYVRCWMSSRQE